MTNILAIIAAGAMGGTIARPREKRRLHAATRNNLHIFGEVSYGNVVLSCGVGNHVVLRGLPGGGRSPAKPVSGSRIPC
jgi:hypothetical protein